MMPTTCSVLTPLLLPKIDKVCLESLKGPTKSNPHFWNGSNGRMGWCGIRACSIGCLTKSLPTTSSIELISPTTIVHDFSSRLHTCTLFSHGNPINDLKISLIKELSSLFWITNIIEQAWSITPKSKPWATIMHIVICSQEQGEWGKFGNNKL